MGEFSMHSFPSEGAGITGIGRPRFGDNNAESVLEQPSTVWTHMRLMEVVAPGSEGSVMIKGVTEEQYKEMDEFPLSE